MHGHEACSTMASWPRCVIRYWIEYRSTGRPNQVAALHEAIEGYSDIQFANIAPARHPHRLTASPKALGLTIPEFVPCACRQGDRIADELIE